MSDAPVEVTFGGDLPVIVTLSAVCDACATTILRVPRMEVQPHGWAMLRLEWWQSEGRACGHNDVGVRFVMQREEPKP